MSDSSGEKDLPPSERKLRKAREEEGQIAHSRDLVQTLNLGAILIYFLASGPSILQDIAQIFEQLSYLQGRPLTGHLLNSMLLGVMEITASIAVVPLVIACFMSVTVGIIDAQGIVFSMKPIMPKLSHLDPFKGFKRMFGSQGLVYLALNFARALIVIILAVVVGYIYLRPIALSATCSFECVMGVTFQTSIVLTLICTGLLIATLVFEIPLSRAFFTKEMKMSHAEAKRENKDISGDPMIKVARQHIRDADAGQFVGPQYIMLMYCGADTVAGVHYSRGRTAAPVLCYKASGADIDKARADARELGAVIVYNDALASALFQEGRKGQFIPAEFFDLVAVDLVKYGLL